MNNDGLRKAAILLSKIGEPHTSNILKYLTQDEMLLVIQEMASIKDISKSEVSAIMMEVLSKTTASLYNKEGKEQNIV